MKITNSDYRLLLILWEHEPINSTILISLCREQFGWEKSTTYSVLRHLVSLGYAINESAIVSSSISKETVETYLTEKLLDDTFHGSTTDLIQCLFQLYLKNKTYSSL